MGKTHKVLVVDDEVSHLQTLTLLLESAGVEAVPCEGAAAALNLLGNGGRFDLIMTDIVMPEIDGFEFARQAKKLSPETPIVLVTGHDIVIDPLVVWGTVALLKPYSIHTLNGVLEEHLGITVPNQRNGKP